MKFLPLFLILAACSSAPLTEEQIYDREVAKIEADERYSEEEAACKRRGGVMVYDYHSVSRIKKEPDEMERKAARCDLTMDQIIRDAR